MKKKKRDSPGRRLIKFFSEIYMLKREKRSGWKLLEAPQDSVADHITIVAQIAYVLAAMEGGNAQKAAVMAVFHDNEETRLTDLHKVSSPYLSRESAVEKALRDQLENLPARIRNDVMKLIEESRRRKSLEAIVVKDADLLEAALQAKVLMERGYKGAKDWFAFAKAHVKTGSAKRILAAIEKLDDFTGCWWEKEKKVIMK